MAREFFYKKYLIGIFAAQTVWRVDKDGLDLSFRSQITEHLQGRSDEKGSTIALIFKDPLFGNRVALSVGILKESFNLA
jgi:hypothetical protein